MLASTYMRTPPTVTRGVLLKLEVVRRRMDVEHLNFPSNQPSTGR